ncbi:MAG: hypothetical protein R2747_04760 [Pyrinomonadaceae bacterium]
MNELKIFPLLILFITISMACQSRLQKELPNDLVIKFKSTEMEPGGSPAGYIRTVIISGNQMEVERSRCSRGKKVTLDEKEIRSLYGALVKSEFDLIRNGAGDGNGEEFKEIYLKTGDASKIVRKGKNFPLSGNENERFNEVWTTMLDISFEKVGPC